MHDDTLERNNQYFVFFYSNFKYNQYSFELIQKYSFLHHTVFFYFLIDNM